MRLVTRRGPSVALVVSHAAGMARPPAAGMARPPAAGMARPPGAAAKRAGHRIPPPLPTTPPPLARASTHEGYVTKSRPGVRDRAESRTPKNGVRDPRQPAPAPAHEARPCPVTYPRKSRPGVRDRALPVTGLSPITYPWKRPARKLFLTRVIESGCGGGGGSSSSSCTLKQDQ